jgi:hypothetical protein
MADYLIERAFGENSPRGTTCIAQLWPMYSNASSRWSGFNTARAQIR